MADDNWLTRAVTDGIKLIYSRKTTSAMSPGLWLAGIVPTTFLAGAYWLSA